MVVKYLRNLNCYEKVGENEIQRRLADRFRDLQGSNSKFQILWERVHKIVNICGNSNAITVESHFHYFCGCHINIMILLWQAKVSIWILFPIVQNGTIEYNIFMKTSWIHNIITQRQMTRNQLIVSNHWWLSLNLWMFY